MSAVAEPIFNVTIDDSLARRNAMVLALERTMPASVGVTFL